MNIAELLASGKFDFGCLCLRKHDHSGKGQSLRRIKPGKIGACKECQMENDKRCKAKHKQKFAEKQKQRRHLNIEETRRKEKEYREKNPQAARDKVKKSYYKHREKRCLEAKEYRINNPERWKRIKRKCYYKHQAKNIEYTRNWRKIHTTPKRLREWYLQQTPLQRQVRCHKYRAKKYGCIYKKYSVKEVQLLFDTFDNVCAYCGNNERIGIDHYVPLIKNGADSIENLIPCCYRCNCRKNDADAWEWFSKQDFYTIERYVKILKSIGTIG